MTIARYGIAVLLLAMLLVGGVSRADTTPAGQATWAVHVALAPSLAGR